MEGPRTKKVPILLLNVILVINAWTAVSAYDLTEPFDLTMILRLKVTDSGYDYPGSLRGEARGEPRELPARVDVGSDSQAYYWTENVHPCCLNWEASGWVKLDNEQAASTKPLLDPNYRGRNSQVLAAVWALQEPEGEIRSPKLEAEFTQPRKDNVTDFVCMKILAKVPEGGRITVIAENTDKRGAMEIGEIVGSSDYKWTLTKLERSKKSIILGHIVRLKLLGKQPRGSIKRILVQWTTFCSDETELRDNYYGQNLRKGSTESHYSMLVPPGKFGTVTSSVCKNGGSLDLDLGLCLCAPGFYGQVCEGACGPNKYGVHCGGLCSSRSGDRQCKGVLMCSKHGCQCFTGLQGDTCDQPCPPGFYGSDCQFKCGACADGDICDRYSGRCENGCEEGQQPPFCQEDCGLHIDKVTDPTETNSFFWHVGIYERKRKHFARVCSGTLIRPQYVLSAAWCFFSEETSSLKPSSRFMVLFGTDKQHCFTDDSYPEGVAIRGVASIHIPPLYRGSKRSFSDDIALVQLERPVAAAPLIGPLCYEPDQRRGDELLDGDFGYIVGWNRIGKDCDSDSRWKGFDMEYISQSTCLSQISETVLAYTDTQKFCTRVIEGTDDSENLVSKGEVGDIGSGFVYFKFDVWYILGVKSGALSNINDTNISVYTKLSNYLDWMTSTWNKLDIHQAVKENI